MRTQRSSLLGKAVTLAWLFRVYPALACGASAFVGYQVLGDFALGHSLSAGLSVFFLACGAFALNDYFDIEVDRFNLPYRPLPSGSVSPGVAKQGAILCYLAAILIAIALGWVFLGYVFLSTIASATYSTVFKRVGILKNVYVAAQCASTLVLGDLSSHQWHGIWLSCLAFGFVLSRELLMDVRDIRGDLAQGIRTIPVSLGPRATTFVAKMALVASALTTIAVLGARMEGPMRYAVASALTILTLTVILGIPRVRSARLALSIQSQIVLLIMVCSLGAFMASAIG